ncbi:RxLR effector protein [Phytophthora megakarya]|uniref:RxLR effector protein n=1 Tax=Phytophthora megakarya TaxID=4795 RepID=A0A225VU81_9STRA|nr:RxLR effector protein [Phytophthora megakarya]
MNLLNNLFLVGICAFLTSGSVSYAESTNSKVTPPRLGVSVDEVQYVFAGGKRFLRREDGDQGSDEERGHIWSSIKGLFPRTGTKSAAAETEIKAWATVFGGLKTDGFKPQDAYKLWRDYGSTKKHAREMRDLFKKYLKNPSAYH